MKTKSSKTERGLQCLEFSFRNGNTFFIQQSSAATEDSLWLSIDSNDINGGRPYVEKDEIKEIIQHLNGWLDSGELFEEEEEVVPEKDQEISIQEFYERSKKCITFIKRFQFASSVPVLTDRVSHILRSNPGLNGSEPVEICNAIIIWSLQLSQYADKNQNMRTEILPVHDGFNCIFYTDLRMCTDDKETKECEHIKHMRDAYLWSMEKICKDLGMKD